MKLKKAPTIALGLLAVGIGALVWIATSAGCDDAGSSGGGGRAASLQASPNPVPGASGAGKTTLSWSTGDDSDGELYVTVDGRPEKKVASGHRGSKEVDWIHPGNRYEFRLYKGGKRDAPAASVIVTKGGRGQQPARATAGPRPAGSRSAP